MQEILCSCSYSGAQTNIKTDIYKNNCHFYNNLVSVCAHYSGYINKITVIILPLYIIIIISLSG